MCQAMSQKKGPLCKAKWALRSVSLILLLTSLVIALYGAHAGGAVVGVTAITISVPTFIF